MCFSLILSIADTLVNDHRVSHSVSGNTRVCFPSLLKSEALQKYFGLCFRNDLGHNWVTHNSEGCALNLQNMSKSKDGIFFCLQTMAFGSVIHTDILKPDTQVQHMQILLLDD